MWRQGNPGPCSLQVQAISAPVTDDSSLSKEHESSAGNMSEHYGNPCQSGGSCDDPSPGLNEGDLISPFTLKHSVHHQWRGENKPSFGKAPGQVEQPASHLRRTAHRLGSPFTSHPNRGYSWKCRRRGQFSRGLLEAL